MKNPTLHAIASCAFILLCAVPAQAAAPAAPTDVRALPAFSRTSADMHVTWSYSGIDALGFEVQRSVVGTSVYSLAATVAPAPLVLKDEPPSKTDLYVYQVRVLTSTVPGPWSAPSHRMSMERVWPLQGGMKNVLHSFGQPIIAGSKKYFHAAVDLTAPAGAIVQAARGGSMEERLPSTPTAVGTPFDPEGGRAKILVKRRRPDGSLFTEHVTYGHMEPLFMADLADPVEPGQVIGHVTDAAIWTTGTYTDPSATHLHWGDVGMNRLASCLTGARDPGGNAPEVKDVNGDDEDFFVVDAANNDPTDETNRRKPAWGNVDFLVDACDDMNETSGAELYQAPLEIGYWISRHGYLNTPVVRSSADPYILTRFGTESLTGPAALGVTEAATLHWDLPVATELATWKTCLTWVVSNSGETKAEYPSEDRFWKTDARISTGTRANKSNAVPAASIMEAEFPDGRYRVQIRLSDLDPAHTHDEPQPVLVDNFAPFVTSVQVRSGPLLVYSSRWDWRRRALRHLSRPKTFADALAGLAARRRDITIIIRFSEPMRMARITAIHPLGITPALSSSQPANEKTVWIGQIPGAAIDNGGADDGIHHTAIWGRDLAGNLLAAKSNRHSIAANHGKRDAAGAFAYTPGKDTIHGFEIGGRLRPFPLPILLIRKVHDYHEYGRDFTDAMDRLSTAIYEGNQRLAIRHAGRLVKIALLGRAGAAASRSDPSGPIKDLLSGLRRDVRRGDWLMARYWLNTLLGKIWYL